MTSATEHQNITTIVVTPEQETINVSAGQQLELQGFDMENASFSVDGESLVINLQGQEPIIIENFVTAAGAAEGVTVTLPNGVEVYGRTLLQQLVSAPAEIEPAAGDAAPAATPGTNGFTPGEAAVDTYSADAAIAQVIGAVDAQRQTGAFVEDQLPADFFNYAPNVGEPVEVELLEDSEPILIEITEPTDLNNDPLIIKIESLPDTNEGLILLNGIPVTVGQTLTPTEVTALHFVPAPNWNGETNFTYSVDDQRGETNSVVENTVNINVEPVNDRPTADNITQSGSEDAAFNITPSGSDVDIATNGQQLSYFVTSQPEKGSVSINPDGSFNFDPNGAFEYLAAGESTTVSFQYVAVDNSGEANDTSAPATITLTIQGANDAPDANDDKGRISEDRAVKRFNVLNNDSDIDASDSIRVTDARIVRVDGSSSDIKGSIFIDARGRIGFRTEGDFNDLGKGETSNVEIQYTITDSHGATDTATLTVTVIGRNDAPEANNDTIHAQEDISVNIPHYRLTGNDTDAENDTLTITKFDATTAQGGRVYINAAGDLTYEPATNFYGQDSFTYTISDGNGGTDTATVNINVAARPDQVQAQDDVNSVSEDGPAVTTNVIINDTDTDNGSLSVTNAVIKSVNGDATDIRGTVSIVNNQVVFNPNGEFEGLGIGESATVEIEYVVNNGLGNGSASQDTGTLTITVNGANDAPKANDDVANVGEDTVFTDINALANDSDPDGDTLSITGATITAVDGDTTDIRGTVSVVNGQVRFEPNGEFNGLGAGESADVTINYTVSDGHNGTHSANITVTVNGTNDAPTANNDTITTNEDTPKTIAAATLLGNDTDPDGDTLTIQSVSSTSANGSNVVLNADGSVTYTPNANVNGADTFTYTVSDGNGGTSTATVTVNVAAVNDDPVANDDSAETNQDQALNIAKTTLLANDTDVDNNTLIVQAVAPASANGGIITMVGDNVVYTPKAGFTGTDTFTYTVSDGQGGTDTATVTVNVVNLNDAPVATDASMNVNENTPLTINVANLLANHVTDADGDAVSLVKLELSDTSMGSLTDNGDGTYTFMPNPSYIGNVDLTFQAKDASLNSNEATLSINVQDADQLVVAPKNGGTIGDNGNYSHAGDDVMLGDGTVSAASSFNIILMVDTSTSMIDTPDNRLAQAKAALHDLLNEYEASGANLTFQLVAFDDIIRDDQVSVDLATARAWVDNLENHIGQNQGTNINNALSYVRQHSNSFLDDTATNKMHFISDADSSGPGYRFTNGAKNSWNTFLGNNPEFVVDAYRVGADTNTSNGTSTSNLDAIDSDGAAEYLQNPTDITADVAASAGLDAPNADTINGGNGNDILIGDYLDADWTLAAGDAGGSYPALRAQFEAANPAATADQIDSMIIDHVQANILTGAGDLDFNAYGATALDSRGGNDIINGGEGNDIILGQGGNDILNGGAGNDIIHGGTGVDRINGGAGDDTIYLDANDAVINGGAGWDTLKVTGNVTIKGDHFDFNDNWFSPDTNDAVTANGLGDRIRNIETIDATNGEANTITLEATDVFTDMAFNVTDAGGNTTAVSQKALFITGDSMDTVRFDANDGSYFSGTWGSENENIGITKDYNTVSVDGIAYNHYSGEGLDLYIQTGMQVDPTYVM